jgi:hypothetical protein
MKRLVTRGSLIVAAFALAGGGLAVSPAGAVTPVTKCASLKGSVTITPGITATPHAQKASAKGSLTKCTPTKATGGSGTLGGNLSLPKNSSCGGLATGKQSLKLAATTKWKNGKTTTYALTATTGSGKAALVATITGKVSKGLFAGKKVSGQIKIAPKSGQNCSPGHPIKNLTFTNTKPWVIG